MSPPEPDDIVDGSIESGACIAITTYDDGMVVLCEFKRMDSGSWEVVDDYKELTLTPTGARALARRLECLFEQD